jgi:hypothetical protein
MKPLAFALLVLLSPCCRTQKAVRYEPVHPVFFQNPMLPLVILEHFARKFPDATPYWGIEGKNYSLRYTDPETSLGHVIIYDRHGNILRNEDEVRVSDCPVSLQQYYLRNYVNEDVSIWTYEEGGSDRRYYLARGSKRVWFDKDGRYLRKSIF